MCVCMCACSSFFIPLKTKRNPALRAFLSVLRKVLLFGRASRRLNFLALIHRVESIAPMYRESILGLALAATLAEINPRLTPQQEEEVWRVFDASMEVSAAEAPLMSHVAVHVPPPSAVAGGGMTAVSTPIPQFHISAEQGCSEASAPSTVTGQREPPPTPATANTEASADTPASTAASPPLPRTTEAPFDDSRIAFPVYRICDGVWTVLLKDPTVVVRDEFGKSEKMQLDYLKVRLKDISDKPKDTRRKRAKKS